jgi:hypothetical protein
MFEDLVVCVPDMDPDLSYLIRKKKNSYRYVSGTHLDAILLFTNSKHFASLPYTQQLQYRYCSSPSPFRTNSASARKLSKRSDSDAQNCPVRVKPSVLQECRVTLYVVSLLPLRVARLQSARFQPAPHIGVQQRLLAQVKVFHHQAHRAALLFLHLFHQALKDSRNNRKIIVPALPTRVADPHYLELLDPDPNQGENLSFVKTAF